MCSLYWSVSEKCKILHNLIKGTTPEEFEQGIVEGVVNDIHIKSGRIGLVEKRQKRE